jgi:hypothetical protein
MVRKSLIPSFSCQYSKGQVPEPLPDPTPAGIDEKKLRTPQVPGVPEDYLPDAPSPRLEIDHFIF